MKDKINKLIDNLYQNFNIKKMGVDISYFKGNRHSAKINVRTNYCNIPNLDDKYKIVSNMINELDFVCSIYLLQYNETTNIAVKKISNKIDKGSLGNRYVTVAIKYNSLKKIVYKNAKVEDNNKIYNLDDRKEIKGILNEVEKEFGIITYFEEVPSDTIAKLYYNLDLIAKNKELDDKIKDITEGAYIKYIRKYLFVSNKSSYYIIDIDGYNFKRNYNQIFTLKSVLFPVKITIRDREKSQYEEIDKFFNEITNKEFNIKQAFDDYFENYYDMWNPEYYNDGFLIRLDSDLINRYLVVGDNIYFIDKRGNVVVSAKKKMITDISQFLDGINVLIKRANSN